MTALRLRECAELAPEEADAVLALADDSARVHGAHPLGEHVVLRLRHGERAARHLLVEDADSGALLGYAHLDTADPDGPAAEVALGPAGPVDAVGDLLIDGLLRGTGRAGLRLWAHGARGPTERLAARHGFGRIRRLWQMRRSLDTPLDLPSLPAGTRVRTFDPDADVPAWLDLNARVFADLPDQGRWQRPDLARRMAQPWFDPDGFLVAEDGSGLVGFHWTKVHDHLPDAPRARVGEVYVIGVAPEARGRGLGRALTLAGLWHLRDLGLATVLLYVDTANTPAVSLYRSLGFAVWDCDTLLRR